MPNYLQKQSAGEASNERTDMHPHRPSSVRGTLRYDDTHRVSDHLKRPSLPPRPHEGRASLATLSKHLGLSAAAISRVLNSTPAARSIPKATQDRIFKAAQELNYRPNVLARSLRRGRSMTLGVLVPEIAEGYTALVLAGLEEALQKAGYFYLLSTLR